MLVCLNWRLCCSLKGLNKSDRREQSERMYCCSVMMSPGEIFDLEDLDNHPWLSPDFHLYSALPWKTPSTLELIRVITTLPIERLTPPDVGSASPQSCSFVLMFHTHLILPNDASRLMLKMC